MFHGCDERKLLQLLVGLTDEGDGSRVSEEDGVKSLVFLRGITRVRIAREPLLMQRNSLATPCPEIATAEPTEGVFRLSYRLEDGLIILIAASGRRKHLASAIGPSSDISREPKFLDYNGLFERLSNSKMLLDIVVGFFNCLIHTSCHIFIIEPAPIERPNMASDIINLGIGVDELAEFGITLASPYSL